MNHSHRMAQETPGLALTAPRLNASPKMDGKIVSMTCQDCGGHVIDVTKALGKEKPALAADMISRAFREHMLTQCGTVAL